MSTAKADYINSIMKSLDIPYQYMTWKGEIPNRYYTGEYTEVESVSMEENGYQETSFMINGFTRESWELLEKDKEALKDALPKRKILEDGSGIAVFYGNAFPIRQDDASLKRIQINLTVKEWKVK